MFLLYTAFFKDTNEFDEAKKVKHSRDNDYLSLVAIFRLDIPLDTMSIFKNAMENVAIAVKMRSESSSNDLPILRY